MRVRPCRYLEEHLRILSLLEQALSEPEHAAFQQLFKDFESQKVCYLPITSLILKPLHRLLHYELLIEREFMGKMVFQRLFLPRSKTLGLGSLFVVIWRHL